MTTTQRRAAFARTRAIFEELADLAPDERIRRLDALAASDPHGAAEARALFAAAAGAPAFLDRPASVALLEGRVLGAWRIVEHLASGGMGDVYRAERADDDVAWQAAVKVLRGGFDGAALVTRFRAERRTLAALQHPNIVALLDVGTVDDGRPYFVMEMVAGLPIDRFCDDHHLDLDARLALFLHVCSAIDHAHQRLTAHCDLKPANVLVTADGHVKVVDFGIAQLLAESDGATAVPLTPGYASPEQERGDPLGVPSDVWSLGILLAELATRDHAAMPNVAVAAVPWRRRLRGDFAAIVSRCLAADPAARYGSVGALAADVKAFLDDRQVSVRRPTRVERFVRGMRRHPWTAAATAVAIVSLGLAATLGIRELERSRADASLGWRAHSQAVDATRLLEELLLRSRADGADAEAFERAVDDARAQAEVTFLERPETLGRLCFAFGALYLDLDRPAKARDALEKGLALARAHRGFGRADTERAAELLERAKAAGAGR